MSDLPASIASASPVVEVGASHGRQRLSTTDLEDIERVTIQRVFEQVKGDKAMAGRMLGISRATLYRKLKRYNIGGHRSRDVSPDAAVSPSLDLRIVRPFAAAKSTFLQAIIYTILVYNGAMPTAKQVRKRDASRKSCQQVDRLAKRRRLSDNRVLVELIEDGIEAQQRKEKAFFELAERFRASGDATETRRLGDELGRFVFGE